MLSSFSFSEDTIGYLIEGNFNEETMQNLHNQILEKLKEFESINLYLEDSNIQNFTLSAVLEDISFKFENSKHFKKIALVTDRKWMHLCATFENLFMDASVKSFSVDDRVKAMNWITEKS